MNSVRVEYRVMMLASCRSCKKDDSEGPCVRKKGFDLLSVWDRAITDQFTQLR